VVFTDPDGKEVGRLGKRDAASLISQINAVADEHTRGPAYCETLDEAVTKGKEAGKPVLYLFTTGKDDSKKLEEALADELLKDLLEKFVLAKREAKKDDGDAKRFGVAGQSQPVIFVVDPEAEKPEEKPLKKMTGKKTAKELKKELEELLKKLEKK
jgi:hypothetical protein